MNRKIAKEFYQKGDAHVLKVLKSFNDTDVESSSDRLIDGVEEKMIHQIKVRKIIIRTHFLIIRNISTILYQFHSFRPV